MRYRLSLAVLAALPFLSGAGLADEATAPGSQLTSKMIEAYREAGAYQATWIATAGADESVRHEIVVAFEPATGMLLVRRQVQHRRDDHWRALPVGEVLISDGRSVRAAVRDDERTPWQYLEVDPDDPITYWVVQRCLRLEPIDLPLILGEHPLMGWLRDVGGAVDSIPPAPADPQRRQGLRITGAADRPVVTAALDGRTHFIQEAMNERVNHRFVLQSMTVNEPLSPRLFEFDRQLEAIDPPTTF